MASHTIDITGPLFQYSNNDSRYIQELFNEMDPKDEVVINWHSPGGDTREGNKLFNMILNHPGKTTSNVILAASAASYAAMAADEMNVFDYSEFMIHRSMVVAFFIGNRVDLDKHIAEMEKEKEVLEELDRQISNMYAKRAKMDSDKILDWMADETTWRGKKILDAGFATNFIDTPPRDKQNLAKFDMSCYANWNQSIWHEKYGSGIRAEEAWAAQTLAFLKPEDLRNVDGETEAKREAQRAKNVAIAKQKLKIMQRDRALSNG